MARIFSYLKDLFFPKYVYDPNKAYFSKLPNEIIEEIIAYDDDFEDPQWKSDYLWDLVEQDDLEYIYEITTENGMKIKQAPPATAMMRTCRRFRDLGLRNRLPRAYYCIFHNDIRKVVNFLNSLTADEKEYVKHVKIFFLNGKATEADHQWFPQLCEILSNFKLQSLTLKLPEVGSTTGLIKPAQDAGLVHQQAFWYVDAFDEMSIFGHLRHQWKCSQRALWVRALLQMHGGGPNGRFREFDLGDSLLSEIRNYKSWEEVCLVIHSERWKESRRVPVHQQQFHHGFMGARESRYRRARESGEEGSGDALPKEERLCEWIQYAMTHSWATRQVLLEQLSA